MSPNASPEASPYASPVVKMRGVVAAHRGMCHQARSRVWVQFSADEVRAALVLTRRAADAQFWLAYDLLTRLPAVHAAMGAGVLDEPRARVLSEWTTELHPEVARAVCDELVPRAPRLTTGQLIEQIKKLTIALYPDWARRRYEHALADRKVVGHRNPDGSANLSGYNLLPHGLVGTLVEVAERAGLMLSEREIRYRTQCAETYPSKIRKSARPCRLSDLGRTF
ncbi:MAG: DUF222 domain-containing protein [Pseudonocardiaceae bacterium]